jgi:MtN3 and saliva related transmembrane protein
MLNQMLQQDDTLEQDHLPRVLLRVATEDVSRHEIMEILGMIGGIAISMSLVPQVWKVYQTKSALDISYVYQGIYIFGLSLVNLYAIVEGLWPVFIPALLELFLIVLLMAMKIHYDRAKIQKLVRRLSTSHHRMASFNLKSFAQQATKIE